ncbi:unnamed protein product [Alopecurus aequalis]
MEEAEDRLGLDLSAGFKFQPEDDELVQHFLLRRILGQPLPLEGLILEVDPLSAPPWELLDKHERKEDDAFFFANGQPMHDNGSRRKQKRSCTGGRYWEGQQLLVKGDRLRVPGMEIVWTKYMLNFHPDAESGSTGWVMHEYSITEPVHLASPLRLYRVRFSGHGEGRKREPDDYAQAKAAAKAAANSATSYSDQDYQCQWVNAMHNWAPQEDTFQDFAVPTNSELLPPGTADFGAYAGPGTAPAQQQYFEEHGSAANAFDDGGSARPAATSYSEQNYQYQWENGTYDWNQVDSSQNVGDYAGPGAASSHQGFLYGNTMNIETQSYTPSSEYNAAAPEAGMLPFGQGSSAGAIDESFMHIELRDEDINIDEYLVNPAMPFFEAPLDDQYIPVLANAINRRCSSCPHSMIVDRNRNSLVCAYPCM